MPSWAKWASRCWWRVGLISIGWRFMPVLVTLHVLVCFVLVIVIMLQSGNAADLAGAFGGAGSQTAFGPRGAATFLSRATTWCAIVFMMTSLALSFKRAPDGGCRHRLDPGADSEAGSRRLRSPRNPEPAAAGAGASSRAAVLRQHARSGARRRKRRAPQKLAAILPLTTRVRSGASSSAVVAELADAPA